MSCRSLAFSAATAAQTVNAGSLINLGSIVRRTGKRINIEGTSAILCGGDYYRIHASITLAPTAAGAVTVQLLQNGNSVQGAIGTFTASAAGDLGVIAFPAVVRTNCCDASSLSLQVVGAEATVEEVALLIEDWPV